MNRAELISNLEHKPLCMPCCTECKGKSKKDCEPNPLNCIDIVIMNNEVLNNLRKEENNDKRKEIEKSPLTNFDRIKNMSIEEMAENLMGGKTFCPYKVFTTIKFCPNSNCDECIKNWLKSEATE